MALRLSSADRAAFRRTSSVLLSPLAFERLEDWCAEVRRSAEPLLRASQSLFILPLADRVHFDGEHPPEIHVRALEVHRDELGPGMETTRRDRGLEVFHWSMMFDPRDMLRSDFYQQVARPLELFEPSCIAADAGPGVPPFGLSFYRPREEGGLPDTRILGILELLLPAFRAGVEAIHRHRAEGRMVVHLVDALRVPAAVFDHCTTLLHSNSALETLVVREAEHERVRSAMLEAARSVASACGNGRRSDVVDPAEGQCLILRTGAARYRIDASCVTLSPARGTPAVLVTCAPDGQASPDDTHLRARFGLTPREIQVARLLARGHSNPEIAATLGVSLHTVRRHVEHVLARLGVRRRAAVAALVTSPSLDDPPPRLRNP